MKIEWQGNEYDLTDINDRLTVAEYILNDMCRIVTSEEAKAEACWAAVHGFSVQEELSKRNGTTIQKALEYCEKVKNVR